MSNPDSYLGEIRLVAWDIIPNWWQRCDGSLLPLNQNTALFSLIKTTYGGDGTTSFAVPDLRGRVPICVQKPSNNQPQINLGQLLGEESVTLTKEQMPIHDHSLMMSTTQGDSNDPAGRSIGAAQLGGFISGSSNQIVQLSSAAVAQSGEGKAHNNMMKSVALNYIISLQGLYPENAPPIGQSLAFMGEIQAFPFNQIPKGWLVCDGSSVSNSEYGWLFNLLGHKFGGSGDNFNLPNLIHCAAIGYGQGPNLTERAFAESLGENECTLEVEEMPSHDHWWMMANVPGTETSPPQNGLLANIRGAVEFDTSPNLNNTVNMNSNILATSGSSEAHENRQPVVGFVYCICTNGLFPSQ
ncbi:MULTISPECIES: phage tail protein [Gammaproteobacteria]|uniref:phage tail protein n=1 Tax=Gammaproteobacteria TaxID=1236 RepID=UPI000DD0663D|nr:MULTISPECIES: tail fiber protein [Gammaproteobacteria]RTE86078.1 hypothetical protein DQX04_05770 [Aliidiomarina sp. B3213]TCZ91432.1 hypothetical protein EYQ95_05780 [Lysobacter sp. N42]